jgi:hypothetical protein
LELKQVEKMGQKGSKKSKPQLTQSQQPRDQIATNKTSHAKKLPGKQEANLPVKA